MGDSAARVDYFGQSEPFAVFIGKQVGIQGVAFLIPPQRIDELLIVEGRAAENRMILTCLFRIEVPQEPGVIRLPGACRGSSQSRRFGGDDHVGVVVDVEGEQLPLLFEVRDAVHQLRLLAGLRQRWKKHSGQNRDDRNYNKEFYQREEFPEWISFGGVQSDFTRFTHPFHDIFLEVVVYWSLAVELRMTSLVLSVSPGSSASVPDKYKYR